MIKFNTFILLILSLVLSSVAFAQIPQKISYQAVIRNSSNELVINQEVGMLISILKGSAKGLEVYVEYHNTTTNANGLLSIEIGGGSTASGDFSSINWKDGPYFIKTETDPSGGTNYTITGTSQLVSVPYAMYAGTAENLSGKLPEKDPIFSNWDKSTGIIINESQVSDLQNYLTEEKDPFFQKSPAGQITNKDIFNWNNILNTYREKQDISDVLTKGNDANGRLIKNIGDPEDPGDAVNKKYVDEIKENIFDELLDAGLNGIMKDVEGNTYKTIKIGEQVWMAENLRTTALNDGTKIPGITEQSEWSELETPAYSWYEKDSINYGKIYGPLYNWYAVETEKLCPDGWRVPDKWDWTDLINYLGGSDIAGGKMKSRDTLYWKPENIGANNISGFSALPGGLRSGNVTSGSFFFWLNFQGNWWSFTDNSTSIAQSVVINAAGTNVSIEFPLEKETGLSIRCIKGSNYSF